MQTKEFVYHIVSAMGVFIRLCLFSVSHAKCCFVKCECCNDLAIDPFNPEFDAAQRLLLSSPRGFVELFLLYLNAG